MLDDVAGNMKLADPDLLWREGWIGGRRVRGAATAAVTDPACGAEIGRVARLGAAEAERAVAAATAALPAWSDAAPEDRAAVLRRWGEAVVDAREDLARIVTAEQGKPLSEARGEIDYAASYLAYYAREATRPAEAAAPSHLPGAGVEIRREPMGVAALVTPWNFPSAMLARKGAAALAAGCTAVAHPSLETPFSALALAELARRAGLPAGVLNVVPGNAPEIVGAWMADPRVRAASFTGSTEVGRLLYRQGADTMKRLVLELGGHAPFVVFADADMTRAVREGIAAKFATSGQDCLGANRFLVERAAYEPFARAFAEATRALSVGSGVHDPDIGPLVSEAAVAKQEAHVADALARGARLLCGGGRHAAGRLFFEPTVLADVPRGARIMREETFGPVAAMAPFDAEDEAVARANDTEFGLVAYLHTGCAERARRVTRALDFGMVAVNRTRITGAPIPFGGVKGSGLGREGSRLGLEAFTEVKYVCRDLA